MLDDFMVECPRCARMGQRGEASPEVDAPVEQPVYAPARKERLPWLTIWLIAAGLCVLVITAAVAITGVYLSTQRPEARVSPPSVVPSYTPVQPGSRDTQPPAVTPSTPLTTPPTPTVGPPSARDIAARVKPSVVMVLVGDDSGVRALGSGFFVRDGVVATNYHVIQNGARSQVKLTGSTSLAVSRVLAIDQQNDLALLQTDTGYANPLNLGDSDRLAVGDVIYAVGNPQGLQNTFSNGIVSALDRGEERLIQISAPISHGSSGGPVLDADGNVIGVAVAYYEGGQNLNFAIPVTNLQALISRAGL